MGLAAMSSTGPSAGFFPAETDGGNPKSRRWRLILKKPLMVHQRDAIGLLDVHQFTTRVNKGDVAHCAPTMNHQPPKGLPGALATSCAG
jgi:hypothetical protein